MEAKHPREALFSGEKPFPIIPACEHFAGSEKLIRKAFELQKKTGGHFDITMDLEDGAPAGREQQHAEMVVDMQRSEHNEHKMAGIRIHDHSHESWRADIDIIIPGAGDRCAYVTIPKPTSASQVAEMVAYLQDAVTRAKLNRVIPVHVLIETHWCACRTVSRLPPYPGFRCWTSDSWTSSPVTTERFRRRR